MQVYRAYFKVLKKYFLSMFIYFAIFFVIAVIISDSIKGQTSDAFRETKSSIAVINNDGDSPLISGLDTYLSGNAEIVSVKDDTETIQDALFYGNVSYVLRIPKGFTQSFLSGSGSVSLEKTASASSASSVSLDLMVNRYFNLSKLYVKSVPGISESNIAANVLGDLKVTTGVDYANDAEHTATESMSYYYQIIAYSILAILLTGIMSIMISFNEEDFSKRNLCSPLSSTKISMQIFLADATFTIIVWALLCLLIFAMYGKFVVGKGIALLCLNALAFSIASMSIAFLASKYVKSHMVQAAVTNVVSLGISFISGVFVSQTLLGKTVQTVSSFTPGYWYIRAVLDIRKMAVYSAANIAPVVYSILIQLGFAAALIIIALVVTKQRKTAPQN